MSRTVYIITFLSLLALGCKESGNVSSNDSQNSSQSQIVEQKKTKRTIAVLDSFFQITNISSAVIEFSSGPMQITAEGDSSSLSHISYDFDGGILTLSTPLDANNDFKTYPSQNDVVVHVSCPVLKAVAICSGGGFRSKGLLKSEDFQLGGMVGGSIDIDSLECKSFRYESNGSTSTHLGNVVCDELVLISTGEGTITTKVDARTSAYLDIKGTSTISADITSPKIENFIDTQGAVSYSVSTDDLSIYALNGSISLKGHANKQDIQCNPSVVLSNELH